MYQTGMRTSASDAPGSPRRIRETDPIGTPRNLTGDPTTSPFTDPLKYDTSVTSWRKKRPDPNTSTRGDGERGGAQDEDADPHRVPSAAPAHGCASSPPRVRKRCTRSFGG